jgi:FADH2 O2-dependent halogenase
MTPPPCNIYDVAIIGSGYSGTIMAMIARRLGLSVLLLERGTHPRVVIGESSTPLSNLLLEELASRYDLPRLLPLTKWGTWQQHYPQLACGLKRGFTFHHHVLGQSHIASDDHCDQLLVAASPNNQLADTHWYRADVDAFLLREAISLGVNYFDCVHLTRYLSSQDVQTLEGIREGNSIAYGARFVIDASGPRGFLHRTLHLQEAHLPAAVATQSLYNHFTGVGRLENTTFARTDQRPPYPIDDAAVHHVFDGGWVWVLQFNNGVTSAGIVATDAVAERLCLRDKDQPAWNRLLASIPALQEQFECSTPTRPFTYIPRVCYSSETIAGDNWAMLPSAAGFVDPMFSTGFPLTLLGIGRMADILQNHREKPSFSPALQNYAMHTHAELAAASRLIGALYSATSSFPRFSTLSLVYFAAVSFAETVRRLGRPAIGSSFLLHDHPTFGPACLEIYERARTLQSQSDEREFLGEVLRSIQPFDIAGLADLSRKNWYPVRAADLLQNAHKVDASTAEICAMLARCGFASVTTNGGGS